MKEDIIFTFVYNRRKKKLKASDRASLEYRYRLGGKYVHKSTGIFLKPSEWNGEKVVKHPDANRFNKKLRTIKNKILDLGEMEDIVTVEQIKSKLEPQANIVQDFIFNYTVKKAKKGNSKTSINRLNYLTIYLDLFIGDRRLDWKEIDYQFIDNFSKFLDNHISSWTKRPLKPNTKSDIQFCFKEVIKEAMKFRFIYDNPYERFILEIEDNPVNGLNFDQLTKLETLDVSGIEPKFAHHYESIKELFLFQCYTGVSWADLIRLTLENIVTKSSVTLLVKVRKKNEKRKKTKPFYVPISELFDSKALMIIKKHSKGKLKQALIFKTLSYATYRKYLIKIGEALGLDFRLNTHVGRATFSRITKDHYLLPLDFVQKMLGHSSLMMTNHYDGGEIERITKMFSQKKKYK